MSCREIKGTVYDVLPALFEQQPYKAYKAQGMTCRRGCSMPFSAGTNTHLGPKRDAVTGIGPRSPLGESATKCSSATAEAEAQYPI
eukprot:CAMPEP_0174381602 /NCGR_PEP_ID=MMETSP0811_2-20130205/124119_1 /TAXON_ID=73025 ORGANISM="Eutreptiella gymnastica-like, Strain CCMP1594" /NCGR_SAMPLE_ID=MMETSP0811_2 /ASSEMBLY_ACC=CAM_ASM_000667 /LENGTH=85 /DNA_ID=CAMNT_0015534795 /DNA_START=406 /DNA_END=664 /DNA_ORIENTATION=+